MRFLWNGTLERAASATGQLCFIWWSWMDIWCWPLDHTPSYCQAGRQPRTHTHSQVMLYYADLLKVNLITLVIPDQRVFLPVKIPSSWGKKEEKNMTTNQKVISWRWHQRQANPSERLQSVDVLPRVVPGEVPGGPRHILHASALRLCVLVTRTERSLGPNALNHTPPPTHCHGRQSRLMQKYWERQSSHWSTLLVCSK